MIQRSLTFYSLLCALFFTVAGSVHTLAFGLQPSIQPVQGIPGLGIPGQQQQAQPQRQQPQAQPSQQSPPPSLPTSSPSTPESPPPPASSQEVIPSQQQQGPNEGIIAHGIVDSLILTPTATTWIATGNWTIGVNNGNAALVTANMTWYNDNGTSSHTHEILNFRPFAAASGQGQEQSIVVQPDNNSLSLRGVVDVGANHRIAWNDVQSTMDIKRGGKILSISLDDTQTSNHFGGRPIFGIVTSFIRCSDVPGPNMEMPTPCLNIPVTSPQPTVTVPPAPPPTTTTAPTVSPPTIAANNNTVQTPTNSATPTPPSGNTTSSRPPISNATGKSPFDILGGG
jgi:hypothetical protein